MPNILSAQVRSSDDSGVFLDCNDGYTCRISVVSPRIIRVLIARPSGLRQPMTWSVSPPGSEATSENDSSKIVACGKSDAVMTHGVKEIMSVPWQGFDRTKLSFPAGLATVRRGRFIEGGFRIDVKAESEEISAQCSASTAFSDNFVTISSGTVSVEVCLKPFGLFWFSDGQPSRNTDGNITTDVKPFAYDRPSRPYFFSDSSFAFRHSMHRNPPDLTQQCTCPSTCSCCRPPSSLASAHSNSELPDSTTSDPTSSATTSSPDAELETTLKSTPCSCPFRAHATSDSSTVDSNSEQSSSFSGGSCVSDLHGAFKACGDVFLGLGDKTGPLNLHGRRLRTAMRDALGFDPASGDPLYKHWPLLLVRDAVTGTCYATMYDNMSEAEFDLGCEHSNYYGQYRTYEARDGDMDMYLVHGPTMSEVVTACSQLQGRQALLPRWSLGLHLTAMPLADASDAQTRIEEFVEQAGRTAVPCSAFHFGSGYTSIAHRRYVFHWNLSKFPSPSSLISRLHSLNLRVVANVKPCLLTDHPAYEEMKQAGGFVFRRRQVEGERASREGEGEEAVVSQFWDGDGSHLDFTNEAAVRWWRTGLQTALLDLGMDAAWNDNNEYEIDDEGAMCRCNLSSDPSIHPSTTSTSTHNMSTTTDSSGCGGSSTTTTTTTGVAPPSPPSPCPLHLLRPVQSLLMTFASVQQQRAHSPTLRPYAVTRAGSFGIQRYAQTWTGDNCSSWPSLRWNLRTGLSLSLSTCFNMGHDVGGFSGPPPEPELLVRWTQAGALHPRFIMNSWKPDGTVTSPWMYPSVLEEVREAVRLRYRLVPYLYALLHEASSLAHPILRPTFLEFENDPLCWRECNEMMLGPFILAAPVVTRGARSRTLYLPSGPPAWYDFYSEQVYAAGHAVVVDAPLHRLPLFAPAGGIIPLTDGGVDCTRLHDEPSRIVRVFPVPVNAAREEESISAFLFYEDDGVTEGGDVTTVSVEMKSKKSEVFVRVELSGKYRVRWNCIWIAVPESEKRHVILAIVADNVPGGSELIVRQKYFVIS